jgi:5-methylcytosine-specific restriction endonuclease McrA
MCKCECGNTASVRRNNLGRGQLFCSKQCPLYQKHAQTDLTGQRFGRLTAVERRGVAAKSRKAIWQFSCECGKAVDWVADNVLSGDIQSCGCLGIESRIKHGKSKTLEYHREAHRKWAAKNPAKAVANANKRREDYRQRIPSWLTPEHWDQINAFYLRAAELTKETGIPHCVDHKHPLRGKTVSGLHVPWNLQVITQKENLHKSARLLDDVC